MPPFSAPQPQRVGESPRLAGAGAEGAVPRSVVGRVASLLHLRAPLSGFLVVFRRVGLDKEGPPSIGIFVKAGMGPDLVLQGLLVGSSI